MAATTTSARWRCRRTATSAPSGPATSLNLAGNSSCSASSDSATIPSADPNSSTKPRPAGGEPISTAASGRTATSP